MKALSTGFTLDIVLIVRADYPTEEETLVVVEHLVLKNRFIDPDDVHVYSISGAPSHCECREMMLEPLGKHFIACS